MKKALQIFLGLILSSCYLPQIAKTQDIVGTYYYVYPDYTEYIQFKSDSTYFHFVLNDKKDTIAQYTDKWILQPDDFDILLCGFIPYNSETNKICVDSKWKYGVRYEDRIGSPPTMYVTLSTPFEKFLLSE